MGAYRKLGINLRFQSLSIVQYLDLYRGSIYNPYAGFRINELFQALGGD